MNSRGSRLRPTCLALLILLLIAGFFLFRYIKASGWDTLLSRLTRLRKWFNDPAAHADWAITAGGRCEGAVFLFPTSGYIGFIWGDSFRPGLRHQGLDIFGGEGMGVMPVIAAYPGYLHHLPDWKSLLIMRIPDDPLQPGRQIWLYYTHMGDANGASYIHFSIVRDDGQGGFHNELGIENTLDPSPYFQLPLNSEINHDVIPVCLVLPALSQSE